MEAFSSGDPWWTRDKGGIVIRPGRRLTWKRGCVGAPTNVKWQTLLAQFVTLPGGAGEIGLGFWVILKGALLGIGRTVKTAARGALAGLARRFGIGRRVLVCLAAKNHLLCTCQLYML